MTEKDIELNKDFSQKGVDMAYINAYNLETGILTGEVRNHINREETIEIMKTLRYIAQTIAKSFQENSISPDSGQAGMMFQYFFDRAVEIFYKHYNDIETESVSFNVQEIFEYYEPDVPYNIQQVLTNRTSQIAILNTKLWRYMEKTGVFETPFDMWFSNFLTVAFTIGFMFAAEIDFDDDSELNAFLYQD